MQTSQYIRSEYFWTREHIQCQSRLRILVSLATELCNLYIHAKSSLEAKLHAI